MATSTGYYIYGFTNCSQKRNLESKAVAGNGHVQNLPFQGIGILCSPVFGKKLRPNRDNLLTHQKVLEMWQDEFTILPVRFGVVAKSKGQLNNGIRSSIPLIRNKLHYLKGKHELVVKAFWNKEYLYDYIIKNYADISKFKNRVEKMKGSDRYFKSIDLGQMVERAVLKEGESEAAKINEELMPGTLNTKKNKVIGDQMFLNLAVLVDDTTESMLDTLVNKAAEKRKGQVTFKYIGPSPPSSFINLHIKF